MVEASLFFLFDAAIVNSYIMYCQQHQGSRLTHEQYRIELAKDILSDANSPVQPIESPQAPHGPHRQTLNPQSCLTECHFPGQLEKSGTSHQLQRDCTDVANAKGEAERRLHFAASSVTSLCVCYLVLNSTTLRRPLALLVTHLHLCNVLYCTHIFTCFTGRNNCESFSLAPNGQKSSRDNPLCLART